MIFKSIDANPSSYLSARIILMIKDGEDLKAVKQIKKQTGFNLEESKNILMKVNGISLKLPTDNFYFFLSLLFLIR